MTGLRPWGLILWQNTKGCPFYSLGVHLDLHTPTLDLHLPGWTIQLGRNTFWTPTNALPGMAFAFGGRVMVAWTSDRWNGHSDNCDHPRWP
jgi:hypothetical protein